MVVTESRKDRATPPARFAIWLQFDVHSDLRIRRLVHISIAYTFIYLQKLQTAAFAGNDFKRGSGHSSVRKPEPLPGL